MSSSTATESALDVAHVVPPINDVADVLAGVCGGATTLYDAAWQVVAYSSGSVGDAARTEALLSRRVPDEALARLRAAGVVERLQRGEVVHIGPGEVDGVGERWAVAVQVDGRMFGTLWVTPTGDRAADSDRAADVRRGGAFAALALVQHASRASIRRSYSPELAGLLSGAPTERAVASRLGLDNDATFVLVSLRVQECDALRRVATTHRVLALVQDYCEAFSLTALLVPVDDTVYLLLPCAGAAQRSRLLGVVTDLHHHTERVVPTRAVLSTTTHLSGVPAVRLSAAAVLDLAERRDWSGLLDADSLESTMRLALFRDVALSHPALFDGPAARLVEHDRQHRSSLVETLRAYFDAVGDINLVGRNLHLHANTVRYRMRRIEEVSGLRLTDPDDRLLAELQVRLLTA